MNRGRTDMNTDVIKTLTELGSTAFVQLLLAVVIWKLAPKLVEQFQKQLDQQREDYGKQLEALQLTFNKAVDDIEESLKKLEQDNERSAKQGERLINLFVSQTAGDDAKKAHVLTKRIVDIDDSESNEDYS